PILISDARYVDAQTQINELDYLASNQNPVLQAELSEFADLQELIIQIDTTTSSESLVDVVENNLTMLESMAYNPSHRGSSVAQILLSEAGIAEFEPEIYLPMEDRSLRFSIVEDAITENFDLNDMIEVYPTPASSEIWIEYLLIDSKPVSKIDIYDVEGKLVLTQSIRNGFGLERVDVSQLSEGNYVLKMGDFSKQISVMK
ncbi:MAG: T9SS type A sorting domain-containing protein, partial [Bacteroidales bacterium]|nr:T9SS type A sorting domain-containing protein [Bacteroidales bacterium]